MADDLPNPHQRISDSSHDLRPHDKPERKISLMKYIFIYGIRLIVKVDKV